MDLIINFPFFLSCYDIVTFAILIILIYVFTVMRLNALCINWLLFVVFEISYFKLNTFDCFLQIRKNLSHC